MVPPGENKIETPSRRKCGWKNGSGREEDQRRSSPAKPCSTWGFRRRCDLREGAETPERVWGFAVSGKTTAEPRVWLCAKPSSLGHSPFRRPTSEGWKLNKREVFSSSKNFLGARVTEEIEWGRIFHYLE